VAWFDRLRTGLKKTRATFTESMSSVLRGRTSLDPAEIEELEEVLIAGDVGGRLATSLVEELAETCRR
jgi:fused signal recognition particle receptor